MTAREQEPQRGIGRKALPANLIERRMTKFMHQPPSVRVAAQVARYQKHRLKKLRRQGGA